MRYVNVLIGGEPHAALLEDDSVVPLGGIHEIGPGAGSAELAAAQPQRDRVQTLAGVDLRPVVPNARKIFCVGLNYLDHVGESGRELPTYPVLFPKFASNLLAPDADLVLPPESCQVDYEGELAVVIGSAGRRIPEAEALDHVLGVAAANDVTMRDYQYKTHQWMQGKAWDASTPIGPAIVTLDEIDLDHAGIRTRLNGETMQESDLGHLIFSVPKLIATVSRFTALSAGDIILTGTPGGVGFRRDPQVFLHDGDVVEVEVDGVGTIRNRVVTEPAAFHPVEKLS